MNNLKFAKPCTIKKELEEFDKFIEKMKNSEVDEGLTLGSCPECDAKENEDCKTSRGRARVRFHKTRKFLMPS